MIRRVSTHRVQYPLGSGLGLAVGLEVEVGLGKCDLALGLRSELWLGLDLSFQT